MDWTLFGFKGIGEVFNLHPIFVHFPVALFPTALLCYAISLLSKKERFELAGRLCLFLATLAAIPTVITGQLGSQSVPHNETIHRIMMTHQKLGFAILGLGLILTFWSWFRLNNGPRKPLLFLLGLVVTTFLVIQNGDLGGRMVFIEGAGVKAAVSTVQSQHQHGIEEVPEDNDSDHGHGDHQHDHAH